MHSPQNLPLKNLSVLCFSLACVLTLSSCGGGAGGGWTMPPPVVDTALAISQPWTVQYQATGTLEAANKVDLNSETPGTVSQITVQEGDHVRRGQTLIRLNANKQLAQVQQSAAGIGASQGGIAQQKADIQQAEALTEDASVTLKMAKSELQRYENLYREQFISQLELDQRRTNYDKAAAVYHQNQEAVHSARARYAQALSTLAQAQSGYRYSVAVANDLVIKAPFSGQIGQKYVDLGDYIAPTEKLLTLVDSSQFKIQFTVPEFYLGQLQIGQPVQVQFEGLGNDRFKGQVNFIDPVIDMAAHTVTVKAILPGTGKLRHGLFGNVYVDMGVIPDAVVIPEEAIVPQGEKSFVYVVRHEVYKPKVVSTDNKSKDGASSQAKAGVAPSTEPSDVAHLQEVIVGHRQAGKVQIQSGLAANERIIVSGLQKISDNMQVNLNGSPLQATPQKGQ